MKEYYVFFDVFGKKLKTKVKANTPEKAAQYVRETIEIIKIEEATTQSDRQSVIDQLLEELDDTMNDLFGKKRKK